MYTHVRVDNKRIAAVDDMDSYETFTTVCGTVYSRTTCGISFDARFVVDWQFTSEVSQQLADLRQRNVVHLGILNLYDYAYRVVHYAPYVESALEKIATLKGPTSRIIYGIGFFYYNDNSSWQKLQVLIIAAKAKDIIVVITCVLSVPSASKCIAMPPTALRSPSDTPPRFDRAVAMAEEKFDSPSQVLAFSFQMGTLIYNMTQEYRLANDAVYKACTGFIVSDSSQCMVLKACRWLLHAMSDTRPSGFLPSYFGELVGPARARYGTKIKMCDDIDPYRLSIGRDATTDADLLPATTYADIFNYLVFTTNYVTQEQMKAYKSLEAHNFFTSGWVKGLAAKELPSKRVVVLSEVNHSQRLRDQPLKTWV
ncbi:hypothetical protein HPB52_022757 [Rhipicephalus sanguineus]|uniref:Uncharacterized protein n=1 Tax=Rhipicephalus sanguineus TaxID=34632 RepID=A0A9D4QEC3_RHISA|nr:hypothetical protein HPB52_022757 [Rhipicephalus sanguineus]